MKKNLPKSLYKQEEVKKTSIFDIISYFNVSFSFNGLLLIFSFMIICFFIYFKRYSTVAFIVFILLLLGVLLVILKFLINTFINLYKYY